MKIGILTYHRTLNYGACLQAIATRVVLEKMGHEVYYVDYWPKYHRQAYKAFSFGRFISLGVRSRLYYLLESIKWYKFRKQRIANFEYFLGIYIYPYCRPTTDEFDAIVYGSDQIWRKQEAIKSYNPVYFAQNRFQAHKHIAYSASMGILPSNYRDLNYLKELLSHFNAIGVREKNLKELLVKIGYTNTKLTIDPTLLLSSKDWNTIIPTTSSSTNKYVLVYGINNVAFKWREIVTFAQNRNLKVKVLSGTAYANDSESTITTANPETFLELIKNAEFIFTSSYHGLAFSLIYNKEFFASYSTNSNRAKTLLTILDIKNRLLPANSLLPKVFDRINYGIVNEKLIQFRNHSINFLTDSLYGQYM